MATPDIHITHTVHMRYRPSSDNEKYSKQIAVMNGYMCKYTLTQHRDRVSKENNQGQIFAETLSI